MRNTPNGLSFQNGVPSLLGFEVLVMRRRLLFLLFIPLLTSCQSKKDICARHSIGDISTEKAAAKLGIEIPKWWNMPRVDTNYIGERYQKPLRQKNAVRRAGRQIANLCEFYKN